MKIAFVRRDYTARGGGAEKYLVTLSRELAKMGEEVHIFAHTSDEPPHPGISIHPVPMIPFISPLKNLSFALNARSELRKVSSDIICSLSRGFYHDIFRISDGLHLYHMRQRYPHTIQYLFKQASPRHRVLLSLEKKSLTQPGLKKIIANSRLAKAQAMEFYGIPEDKIEVIYNGIDPSLFNPSLKEKYRSALREKFGIPSDSVIVLFVAMDLERKGLFFLLQALSQVREKKFKLLVVGKTDSGRYQMLADKLMLTDKITFAGYYPQVEYIYGLGDILVLPTLYDPFSNCCLEALACGIPVITTRQNGAAELIRDGSNGYVVDEASNVKLLAEKISFLLSRETREKMGEQASCSVEGLTMEANAGGVLKVFQEVLAEKNKS